MAKDEKKVDNTKKTSIFITVGFIGVVVLLIVGLVLYNTIGREKSSIQTDTPTDRVLVNSQENASNFIVRNLDGDKVRLSDYNGKLIVINFWATWCEPCKSEMEAFQNAYDKYKDQVEFLMINTSDDAQTTKKFIEDNGYSFPTFVDEEESAAKAYGVSSIPTTVMIDKKGNIHYQNIGTMTEKSLFSFIDGLINKK